MYESKKQPLLSRAHFVQRLIKHGLVALALLALSLLAGMAGYVNLEKLSWVDAFVNSAMLLGGMGPVNAPLTTGGKLFAGFYALYAGLVFLALVDAVVQVEQGQDFTVHAGATQGVGDEVDALDVVHAHHAPHRHVGVH